jgi:hypothetical protein
MKVRHLKTKISAIKLTHEVKRIEIKTKFEGPG